MSSYQANHRCWGILPAPVAVGKLPLRLCSLRVSLKAPGKLSLDLNEISCSPKSACFPIYISNLETIKAYHIKHFLFMPLRPIRVFWKGPSGVFGMMIMLAKDENLSDGCHSVKKSKCQPLPMNEIIWEETISRRYLWLVGNAFLWLLSYKRKDTHIYYL